MNLPPAPPEYNRGDQQRVRDELLKPMRGVLVEDASGDGKLWIIQVNAGVLEKVAAS